MEITIFAVFCWYLDFTDTHWWWFSNKSIVLWENNWLAMPCLDQRPSDPPPQQPSSELGEDPSQYMDCVWSIWIQWLILFHTTPLLCQKSTRHVHYTVQSFSLVTSWKRNKVQTFKLSCIALIRKIHQENLSKNCKY